MRAQGTRMRSSTIFSKPDVVSRRDVTLQLVIAPDVSVPAGGAVELKLPLVSDVFFSAKAFSSSVLCERLGDQGADVLPCAFGKDGDGRQTITWTLTEPIEAADATQISAIEVFNNPITTESTPSFELRTYTDASKS